MKRRRYPVEKRSNETGLVIFAIIVLLVSIHGNGPRGEEVQAVAEAPKPTQAAGIAPTIEIVPERVLDTRQVEISYFTASPDETDSTPHITADGTDLRETTDNVVAANWLPFGTRVSIAGVEYIVHDRMNPRYGRGYMDILVDTKQEAYARGRHRTEVIIFEK